MHGPVRGGGWVLLLRARTWCTTAPAGLYRRRQRHGHLGRLQWLGRPRQAGWQARAVRQRHAQPREPRRGPDGRVWYADNQGDFVATSKLFVLRKDAYYGHPAGLVDLPGMTPASPEIQ